MADYWQEWRQQLRTAIKQHVQSLNPEMRDMAVENLMRLEPDRLKEALRNSPSAKARARADFFTRMDSGIFVVVHRALLAEWNAEAEQKGGQVASE